jgi:uncharacterized membrane protein YphA (DoxX/SURF4 family)
LAVAALVLLRLGLGCHFLYEGVWKIVHRDKFTAEPFLTQAKGPLAGLFYAMVPDLDGRRRLRIVKDDQGRKTIPCEEALARCERFREDFLAHYRPACSDAEAAKKLEQAAQRTFDDFRGRLKKYLQENLEDIEAYFAALERFEQDKEIGQDAAFQKQRRWERMMELRREVGAWLADIAAQEKAYQNTLYGLLDEEQKKLGLVPGSINPFRWDRMEQINFAVTWGLTAIGICLMLGFFTPLAALGGAAFMAFVVMTQPAFPGIYPPDPDIVGHALLVNKDFVEMLALLVVAATAAGRWGGLDFFLARWCKTRCCRRENVNNKK